MKIFKFLPLVALAVISAACKSDDPVKPEVTFSLAESNITVSGLSQECLVNVDNAARAVDIYADYADKDNIKALEITFNNLEEGVEVNYSKVYNYSAGAQKVVFVKEETSFEYTFAVTVGEPVIKFNSFTVAGADALGGEAKVSGGADLTALEVVFEVSPSDAKVFVGDAEIVSGATVDFSDKVNGVNFVARVGSVEKTLNIKAVTTGISEITRVWGVYYKPFSEGVDAKWFGSQVSGEANIIRTVAMNDEYVFLSKDKDSVNPTGGVYAVSISDPNSVRILSQNGIAAGTRFFAITTLENSVLAASFAMGEGQKFSIYAWDDVNSDPRQILSYTTTANVRLGDKITVEGTWSDGKIWCYDSTSGTKVYCFAVSDGKVNAAPAEVDLDTKMGTYAGFYPYSGNQYICAGAGVNAGLFTVDGTLATLNYSFPSSLISSPTLGIRFFTFNEENYMGYVALRNGYTDGQMRVSALSGETLQESIDNLTNTYKFWLGDPNATEDREYVKNANGCGDGTFRVIGDKTYYAAFVTGTGLSLFEIK
jgi:hypothetical protein